MNNPTHPKVVLLIAVVAVVVLPYIPIVRWFVFPLMWLGTLVHEAGHALCTLALGGNVTSVEVFFAGGGLAQGTGMPNDWTLALIPLCGLIGPAVMSAVLLVAGRTDRRARVVMGILGVLLLALGATLTIGFGTIVAVGWGLLALFGAWRLRGWSARMGLLTIAVQLALKVYRGSGYLFTYQATVDGRLFTSDVGVIADHLGGPYWAWGLGIGLLDLLLLLAGAYAAGVLTQSTKSA